MNCTECTARLHDYVDGELAAGDRCAVDAHVAQCPACRAQQESLRALLTAAAGLPRQIAPSRDLWSRIADEMDHVAVEVTGRTEPIPEPVTSVSSPRRLQANIVRFLVPLAAAACVVFLALYGARTAITRRADTAWTVASVAGAPRIGTQALHGEGRIQAGQWLETDAASRARVSVGQIGEVNVDPNSRLRVLHTAATDHRLELARGTMHAFIVAPPRIFVVDTPTAKAVDLGCAYTLNVDDNGNGTLHVTTGYVALEVPGRESYIPGGAMCETRRGTGPGTPFMSDAPTPLRVALERIDFERDTSDATLADVLRHARVEDAVTLWHLLARTQGPQLASVFDRLAELHAPPAGVTRAGILAGDVTMRRTWGADLNLGPW